VQRILITSNGVASYVASTVGAVVLDTLAVVNKVGQAHEGPAAEGSRGSIKWICAGGIRTLHSPADIQGQGAQVGLSGGGREQTGSDFTLAGRAPYPHRLPANC